MKWNYYNILSHLKKYNYHKIKYEELTHWYSVSNIVLQTVTINQKFHKIIALKIPNKFWVKKNKN